MKPWNIKMTVAIDADIVKSFIQWYKTVATDTGRISTCKNKQTPCPEHVIEYIKNIYNDGYGLKCISSALGLSYTKLRSIFKLYDIEIRHGLNIVTDRVKAFRSERVVGQNNPWSDWECRKNIHSNGIQGKYITKSGETVWMRSCWEYIFCKWLDSKNVEYKVEDRQYTLSDGSSYRPDFFIYENGKLKYVIEIKGYIKDKLYKTVLLEKEHGIKVVVVDNINDYCENYEKELKLWKQYLKK